MNSPIPTEYYRKAQRLKKLGREVGSYPDNMFSSNCLNGKEVKLQHYINARQYLSGKDKSYQWLDALIKEAREDLIKLRNGEQVIFLMGS